jgi:diguanylate cyclase (GGDEF)-like protein
MDINLPDMSGYEVTTLLKSIKALQHTPIIALSAYTQDEARDRTLIAGCEGFIAKPINVKQFVKLVDEYLKGRKETLAPEVEKKFLSEYNIALVEKLQNKVVELEKVNYNLQTINSELNNSKNQLTHYNNRLFTMNNLANSLRLFKSPEALLNSLPLKIIEGFQVDRCIIFEYHGESQRLNAIQMAGTSKENLKKLKIHIDYPFYQNLKREVKLLWIKNKDEILNESLLKLAQSLNTASFILASLTGFSSREDSSGIFKAIMANTDENSSEEIISESPRKLLIFLDRGNRQAEFATYEIRVLKAFLQNAGTIYENMFLYHRLIKMLQIKEQEAITDPLTNVYNYRYFQSQIEREIVRSQRHKKSFSIAMIDIDNFKQYNDTHGHYNGDLALKVVAKALYKNIRKSDTLARYGGDEFIIILPELDKSQAKALAEKLCSIIEKTKLPRKKFAPKIVLTISLGISTYPNDGIKEEILLKKADHALYQAKSTGRNTVCLST